MSPIVLRIIMTVVAAGCFVGAAFLPTVKAELMSAGVGLLAWAHAPIPGEKAAAEQAGAAKEAAAQAVGMTTLKLPPLPSPPNFGGPE